METNYLFYLLLVLYIVSHSFIYRFDRTVQHTLKLLEGTETKDIEKVLTPPWFRTLVFINWLLVVLLAAWALFYISWILAIVIILYHFFVAGVIEIYQPLPTHRQCVRIMKSSLFKYMENHPDDLEKLLKLREEIERIEQEYL